MTSTVALPAPAVVDLLRGYWELADGQRKTLNQYRDADGDVKDGALTDYDDSRTTTAIEASDFLDGAMERLAALVPLPDGITVTVPGQWHKRFTVTTGRLDDAARKAFTNGQCQAMARALADATGWPMAVLVEPECKFDPDQCGYGSVVEDVCACQLVHLVVVRPDGALIDIDGAHAPGAVPGAKGLVAVEADEALWRFVSSSPHWRRPALAVARTFVAPLLAYLKLLQPNELETALRDAVREWFADNDRPAPETVTFRAERRDGSWRFDLEPDHATARYPDGSAVEFIDGFEDPAITDALAELNETRSAAETGLTVLLRPTA
ncbi:hypothetical protein ACWDZ4_20160 [Streptomyces sp. NPDC003016]